MRASRRHRVVGFGAALLAACSVLLTAEPAGAYAQEENFCDKDVVNWHWATGDAGWNSTLQDWVRQAFASLDNPLDYDGTHLVDQNETTGGAQVKRMNLPGNKLGYAECSLTDSVQVDTSINSSMTRGQEVMWQVARHEMFHLMGAEHVGQFDSFNGDNPPTMATCIPTSTYPDTNRMEQDGSAYQNLLHSSLGSFQMHANIGFEGVGLKFWGKSAGSGSTTVHTTGGATGPYYIGWNSTDLADYIYQTVRVLVGDDDVPYYSKANGESPSSSFTTRVRVRLYQRIVTLDPKPAGETCETSWTDGIDWANGLPSTGNWTLLADSGIEVVPTSWTIVDSALESIANLAPDAHDFQIRVYATAVHNSTGGYGHVHLDNVRGTALGT